jgi:hypothetical protein
MTSTGASTGKAAKTAIVKTRLSGVVLSLPSEGKTNLRGVVMLSDGLSNALWKWASQPIPNSLKSKDRTTTVDRLAAKAVSQFGIPRDRAQVYAEARADRPQPG